MLITNARIFEGEHEALASGMSVLVEGVKIACGTETLFSELPR